MAHVVGSTSALIKAVVEGSAQEYIVATDNGILHRMRQLAPTKTLIEAPTAGNSATCKSCAHCPWMAMNGLANLVDCLESLAPEPDSASQAPRGGLGDSGAARRHRSGQPEIHVDEPVRVEAQRCINRMLDFTAARKKAAAGMTPGIGAA
jgi:quinolinate synthase